MLHTFTINLFDLIEQAYGDQTFDNLDNQNYHNYYEQDENCEYVGKDVKEFVRICQSDGVSEEDIESAYNDGYMQSITDEDFKQAKGFYIDKIVKDFSNLPKLFDYNENSWPFTWKWTKSQCVAVVNNSEVTITTNLNNLLLMLGELYIAYWGNNMFLALAEITGERFDDCKSEISVRKILNSMSHEAKIECFIKHLHMLKDIENCYGTVFNLFQKLDYKHVNYYGTHGDSKTAIAYAYETLGVDMKIAA